MRLLETIDSQSNLRNLAVMIVSSFVVVMVMATLTQTWVYDVYGDVTIPDTRLTYSITEITDVFNTLGQAGLNVGTSSYARFSVSLDLHVRDGLWCEYGNQDIVS